MTRDNLTADADCLRQALGFRPEIIERAGHNPQREQTTEVIRIVNAFMATTGTPLRWRSAVLAALDPA